MPNSALLSRTERIKNCSAVLGALVGEAQNALRIVVASKRFVVKIGCNILTWRQGFGVAPDSINQIQIGGNK